MQASRDASQRSHLASKEQKVKVGGRKYVAFQLHQSSNMERMDGRKKKRARHPQQRMQDSTGAPILEVPCCIEREKDSLSARATPTTQPSPSAFPESNHLHARMHASPPHTTHLSNAPLTAAQDGKEEKGPLPSPTPAKVPNSPRFSLSTTTRTYTPKAEACAFLPSSVGLRDKAEAPKSCRQLIYPQRE